jgi:predicted ATPase
MTATRISRLEVQNFKSLVDFQLDLPKFTCLIGLNGSGKSTVLQFVDFVSQLMRGGMKTWLAERKWKASDLKSKLGATSRIAFRISFADDGENSRGSWTGLYSVSKQQCIREELTLPDAVCVAEDGHLLIKYERKEETPQLVVEKHRINFEFDGSVFSTYRKDLLPNSVVDVVTFMRGIKSLDLLSPQSLRQRTRASSGSLGRSGQNLAAFIHEMADDRRQNLIKALRVAYPRLQDIRTKSLRSGWKQLAITEQYDNASTLLPMIETEARHVNDGLLRMLTILAELDGDNRFLLFEEIENGINPELVEFLVDHLVHARQQVLVTTHSPLILNYLEDDTATKGVMYLYKQANGQTQAIPFFSIPSLRKKLVIMGPGEVFVDTKLTELDEEIAAVVAGEQ